MSRRRRAPRPPSPRPQSPHRCALRASAATTAVRAAGPAPCATSLAGRRGRAHKARVSGRSLQRRARSGGCTAAERAVRENGGCGGSLGAVAPRRQSEHLAGLPHRPSLSAPGGSRPPGRRQRSPGSGASRKSKSVRSAYRPSQSAACKWW